MPRRVSPFGLLSSGIASVLLAVAFSLDNPAHAECIMQPNQLAPEGAHWSLHFDHAKNRRCWILVDSSGHELSAPPEPAPASGPAPAPTVSPLQTFFSNLTGGPPAPPPPPQQAPPAAASVTPPPHRPPSHVANVKRPPFRTQKDDTARHELTPAERDALFEEFLRWRKSQQMTGGQKQPPQ